MKTYLDCFPCFMNQALRAGRLAIKDDDKKIKELLDNVGDMIKKIPVENTPVETGAMIYSMVREITGINDPYKKIKEDSIKEALSMYSNLKSVVRKSKNPLLTAVRVAIAGNVIDFGIDKKFDISKDMQTILKQDFEILDFEIFNKKVEQANNILYIGDNAGESVFDKILIEELNKTAKVTYAVRDVPVINDVIYDDAVNSGLNEVSEIISSGCHAPGTILEFCNADFIEKFSSADIVISKGQGNYEGLSECKRSVFFLLKAKCRVIANDLNVNKNAIVLKAINTTND